MSEKPKPIPTDSFARAGLLPVTWKSCQMLEHRWGWRDVAGLVLADTGKAIDEKERKYLDIETREDKFVAVKIFRVFQWVYQC